MTAPTTRMDITLKRVYEPPTPGDGVRVLVDRLWPRGLRKEDAAIDHHLKEIAPSAGLRKWFAHDPKKWAEFRRRYERELRGKRAEIAFLRREGEQHPLTLLYGAKDSRHNNAVVLRAYLLRLQQKGSVAARRKR